MICKLCHQEKKPKSNTHYLSDFIIKSALNEDGANTRGKGLYWGIDTSKLSVDFKFQQVTSPETLENILGRQTTSEENDSAENEIDFTVSDSFCKECEDIFTKIENEFANKVLSKFRNSNLNGVNEKVLNKKEARISRLFFLLQFWRTSQCDSAFDLSQNLSEFLRVKILNEDNTGLESIPMSITYLETLKDSDDIDTGTKYKTQNVVMPLERNEPFAIIMNDFVIQLYEDLTFPYFDFYGYNDSKDYINYLNQSQEEFKVKILSNEDRKIASKICFTIAAKSFMANHAWFFLDKFTEQYRKLPTNEQIAGYLQSISEDNDIMKFSSDKLKRNILEYFKTL